MLGEVMARRSRANPATRFTRGAGPPCGEPPGTRPRMKQRCWAKSWLGEAEPTLRRVSQGGQAPLVGNPPGAWPRVGYRCRAEPWLGEAEPSLRREKEREHAVCGRHADGKPRGRQ